MLEALAESIVAHTGAFRCVQIHGSAVKSVDFRHVCVPANGRISLPVSALTDFYSAFESVILYQDPVTQEAAFEIVPPHQWPTLGDLFQAWLDDLTSEEADEYLPEWIDECVTVGEIPRSGNYLLVPLSGSDAGKVFEFEHDGFEFLELAPSLTDFVAKQLDLDGPRLTTMASHLRFVEEDAVQWWIEELVDNRGNKVQTEA